MGIRFYCPSGHKLHVKAYQAGKRGICPYCGAKMVIPRRSTRPSRDDQKAARQAVEGDRETPIAVHEPAASEPQDEAVSLDPAGADPVTAPNETRNAAAPEPASSPRSLSSALAENPKAVWYVRPSAGGQYGPATPPTMQVWLDENRIGADSLVWREGWRDWKSASEVFPEVTQKQGVPVIAASAPLGTPSLGSGRRNASASADPTDPSRAPTASEAAKKLESRRSRARLWNVIIVILLTLIIIALSVILIWVLMRDAPSETAATGSATFDRRAPATEDLSEGATHAYSPVSRTSPNRRKSILG